jgi:uncharacterized membrane protein YeiH
MSLLSILDLIGTLVFAISGATAGVKRRLDVFGILVLAFVAGNVGGITRDVLIGSVPPAAISDRPTIFQPALRLAPQVGAINFLSDRRS